MAKTKNQKEAGNQPNQHKVDRKSQINNEIIHAQGKFKQAKITTIRKLVDKLKNPGKNPKQNRAAKAERYQNVLNHIKHMPPKRLGLLALLYYKSGKNHLSDSNATVEQLSVGYFSQFKGLNEILDGIRTKLNLNESSNWRRHVRKLFKKRDKSKQKEKVQEMTPFNESDNLDVNTESKSSGKKSKLKSNGDLEKSLLKTEAKKEKTKQSYSEESNEVVAKESDESSDSDENSEEEIVGKNDVAAAPTTVDDFFITADGSNYLSTAVVSQNQEKGSDDESKSHLPRNQGFEKKSKESSFFHKSDKKPMKLAVNRFEGTKRKWTDNDETQDNEKKQTKIDPELHPSWQAKQKLKPTITEFKGKKITFD